jgi:hypothetical protein
MSLATAARSASNGIRALTVSLARVQRAGRRVGNAATALRTFGVQTAATAQLGHFDRPGPPIFFRPGPPMFFRPGPPTFFRPTPRI